MGDAIDADSGDTADKDAITDLDEALNELGVLTEPSKRLSKWHRRHPLRREKERELSWCSSSSSSASSCSSRRSSSSSSSGSFSSLGEAVNIHVKISTELCHATGYSSSSFHSRSSLTSYSIAETPTGQAPGVFGQAGVPFQSTGSFGSTASPSSSLGYDFAINRFRSLLW